MLIGSLPHLRQSVAFRPASNTAGTIARLQRLWQATFPGKPFSYHFLDESIARQYAADIRFSRLVQAATALKILISCMGLLGLILYVVEKKKKEISI